MCIRDRCNRGEINFTAKGNNAVAAGAIGTIVVNNAAGTRCV